MGTYEPKKFHKCAFHPHLTIRSLVSAEFGLAEHLPVAVTYTHLPAGAVMESRPFSVALPTIHRSVGFHEGNVFVSLGSVKKPEALPWTDDQN